jgi:lysyl-tRNA synthetase class 1
MYNSPRKAKRLDFDVIPKAVDEYLAHLGNFSDQEHDKRLGNPVWHIHTGNPPEEDVPISFAMLLNLASVCNTEDPAVLWGFISRYVEGAKPENHPILDRLAGYAIAYYRDFVRPDKHYRAPEGQEIEALGQLADKLEELGADAEHEAVQSEVYAIGKANGYENLRDWFKALYETLLGQSQGPRMGSFLALYGVDESVALIRRALAGEDLSA